MEFTFADFNRFSDTEITSLSSTAQLFTQMALNSPAFASVVGVSDSILIDTDLFKPTYWDIDNNRVILSHSTFDGYYSDSYSVSGGVFRDINRIIFHELAHRASTSPSTVDSFLLKHDGIVLPVSLTEAFAIFAENAIFDPLYAPNGSSYGPRSGHSLWGSDAAATGGISGLEAFNWIGSSQGTMLHRGTDGVSFLRTSDDGRHFSKKTYHPTINIDGQDYSHYITVSSQNKDGFFTNTGSGYSLNIGASSVLNTLMGGKSAALSVAVTAASKTLSEYGYNGYLSQDWISGLSGERYYSLGEINGTKYMFDFNGVGYRVHLYSDSNDTVGAVTASSIINVIHQRYDDSEYNSIIMGAAGSGFNLQSTDNIKAGSGNDFIISSAVVGGNVLRGGGGNDLILGSTKAGDQLYGDGGSDLFIARAGGTFYDGGSQSDTLSYANRDTTAPITLNSSFHAVSSRFGTDNYADIETLIGTPGGDIFNLGADHPVIYGGWGSDKFFGTPTASIYAGRGVDTLDLTGTSTPLQTLGMTLDSIETIRGSDGDDIFSGVNGVIFTNVEPNVVPSIFGGSGNDYIEVYGSISVSGGADNDTVVMRSGSYGLLDGGDGFDTLDFSQIRGSNLTVVLDGTGGGTYRVDSGDNHGFKNFEDVKFGPTALFLHGVGTFTAGTGKNTIYGSAGDENITISGTGGWVRAGNGKDVIHSSGLESVYGEGGDDRLFAGDLVGGKLNGGWFPGYGSTSSDGNDFLQGGALADTLSGGTGVNEMHGGGGYDHFYSGGYGENAVYGDGDLGAMHYSFAALGGYPVDPDLVSIQDMGGWFDVTSTPDHGQTFYTDHLYDIDKVIFQDRTFDLTPGFSYDSGLFLI